MSCRPCRDTQDTGTTFYCTVASFPAVEDLKLHMVHYIVRSCGGTVQVVQVPVPETTGTCRISTDSLSFCGKHRECSGVYCNLATQLKHSCPGLHYVEGSVIDSGLCICSSVSRALCEGIFATIPSQLGARVPLDRPSHMCRLHRNLLNADTGQYG